MSIADYVPQEFVSFFSAPGFKEAFVGFTKYLLNEDNEFRETVKTYFEECLVFSEYRPVQDITKLKKVTGLVEDEDEEREPNIPERIEALEEMIETGNFAPTENSYINKTPETLTEDRADLLVEELDASGKEYFSARDIVNFLSSKLPDRCKLKDGIKNIRKVKQDVLEMVQIRHKGKFSLNKKKVGHKEVRLVKCNPS